MSPSLCSTHARRPSRTSIGTTSQSLDEESRKSAHPMVRVSGVLPDSANQYWVVSQRGSVRRKQTESVERDFAAMRTLTDGASCDREGLDSRRELADPCCSPGHSVWGRATVQGSDGRLKHFGHARRLPPPPKAELASGTVVPSTACAWGRGGRKRGARARACHLCRRRRARRAAAHRRPRWLDNWPSNQTKRTGHRQRRRRRAGRAGYRHAARARASLGGWSDCMGQASSASALGNEVVLCFYVDLEVFVPTEELVLVSRGAATALASVLPASPSLIRCSMAAEPSRLSSPCVPSARRAGRSARSAPCALLCWPWPCRSAPACAAPSVRLASHALPAASSHCVGA